MCKIVAPTLVHLNTGSFEFPSMPLNWVELAFSYFHLTSEDTAARVGSQTCLKSHSWLMSYAKGKTHVPSPHYGVSMPTLSDQG